mmetsp:Transcript_5021/g.11345  ORF Transcript_5021/g.11345 Transcript_5021/m.11345 type:complete len:280 (+) Transcript_5021:175-1014(+)
MEPAGPFSRQAGGRMFDQGGRDDTADVHEKRAIGSTRRRANAPSQSPKGAARREPPLRCGRSPKGPGGASEHRRDEEVHPYDSQELNKKGAVLGLCGPPTTSETNRYSRPTAPRRTLRSKRRKGGRQNRRRPAKPRKNKEGLRLDTTGKPFTCKNQACVDAKKDLGHGVKKPCPKKGNKEENAGVRDLNHQLEESRTQKNKYVAMKFVGGKVKEKSVTILFGGGKAGVGISHTSQKAGVGPVPAVSANDAPPTGPQECVGQDDATRLGQASKSSKSLFA